MAKIPFSDTVKFDSKTTLFVTDLDGTLLTPAATLPEGAAEAVWDLHRHGVHLTYATARTIRSAAFILEGLPFPAPIALMNGVLMRDMNEGRYVDSNLLSPETADRILSVGGEPFVYTLTPEGELFTAYHRIANEHMEDFRRERVDKYAKPFRQLEDFHTLIEEKQRIIYFCYLDTEEHLRPIHDAIVSLRDPAGEICTKCAFYPDHYRPGLWYLEVFAPTASKGTVIRRLREMTGAKTVVCFGDNGNDLPMFAESDYAFAVERAADAFKAAADAVIPGGMGVIEFIREHTIG
jgi:hydroxymethylpyrimidine pyrophosphatase-like HAD family hydrolase